MHYKAEKTDFNETLSVNKEIADSRVEGALYRRALGYTVTETIDEYEVYFDNVGKAHPTGKGRRKVIKKELPGEPGLQRYWLEKRQPGKFGSKNQIQISTDGEQTFHFISVRADDTADTTTD